MRVIGTAGHVDHGKSTLVKALTGIDPDRLREEKAREMTIDLGFAYLTLPDGQTVGIVDVPGHKDFIENMLAGVGAISSVLFVVDANEGFMPQTREHLHILDQLNLESGLIVLTKCDLVSNPDWFDLLIDEIREEVHGTFLSDAPILKVSAKTGEGLDGLVKNIAEILNTSKPPGDSGKPRLSIDRVFALHGFGTVVTGTLLDGRIKSGDEVFILGEGKRGRIRGLQSHNKKVDEVFPGSRIAINISGLEASEIKRGDLLQKEPEAGSTRIDAWIQLLNNLSRPLKHNDQVKVFHLASEHIGRIRILGADEIAQGMGGYVQIEFESPLFARKDDRFIIRFPSPSETIGGGKILQTNVRKRYKRFSPDILEMLSIIRRGSLDDKIIEVGKKKIIFNKNDIDEISSFTQNQVKQTLSELVDTGSIIKLSILDNHLQNDLYILNSQLKKLIEQVRAYLEQYHAKYPLRFGATLDEFQRLLKFDKSTTNFLLNELVKRDICKAKGNRYSLPNFSVKLSFEDQNKLNFLNKTIDKSRFSPPGKSDLISITGHELFNFLVINGDIIQLSNDVIVRKSEFDEMFEFTKKTLKENGKITVSEFRDAFHNSRKYALALLEYLDEMKVTKREGDYRILNSINKEQA